MTLRAFLQNPPVRMATDAEVRREYGVTLGEWLRAWREMEWPAFERWKAERREAVEKARRKRAA